jgi:nitrite reductase (cytochrome c-552)
MAQPAQPAQVSHRLSLAIFSVTVVAVLGIALLASLLVRRNVEKQHAGVTRADIPESEYRNGFWGRYFPRQYDSYRKTGTVEFQSKYGGSADRDMLSEDPRLVVLWAGYGFSKDYRQGRGHAHAVDDVRKTLRTGAPTGDDDGPMPSACWTCKGPGVVGAMKREGIDGFYKGKWARFGKEIVEPVGCADCHDPSTMDLTITRPALVEGLAHLGRPLEKETHQSMRSLTCAQCHVEYYFDKKESGAQHVSFPWHRGTSCEQMEAYYDTIDFADWTHPISKARMLKAQHPDFELFLTGVHAERGLSCAECHMPYQTEGGQKFTSHHAQSPLNNVARTCRVCHREETADLVADVYQRQDRIAQSRIALEKALVRAHVEAGKAWQLGATDTQMAPILLGIRHAQWRWDFAAASHGASFHSPVEVSRIVALGLDAVQQARVKLARVLAALGHTTEVEYPSIATKADAQRFIGLDLEKINAEKKLFLDQVVPKWLLWAREHQLIESEPVGASKL